MNQALTRTRFKHQPWCATEIHDASADPDLGPTESCVSAAVIDGSAFAYLDGGPGNTSPRLVENVPLSHPGWTTRAAYRAWRAAVDQLAAQLDDSAGSNQ